MSIYTFGRKSTRRGKWHSGYSPATLRRAFRELRGQAIKQGQRRWLGKLPSDDVQCEDAQMEDARNAGVGIMSAFEPRGRVPLLARPAVFPKTPLRHDSRNIL
jgi:hypothetical protein